MSALAEELEGLQAVQAAEEEVPVTLLMHCVHDPCHLIVLPLAEAQALAAAQQHVLQLAQVSVALDDLRALMVRRLGHRAVEVSPS
tara:strand:- start:21541 stop:21798 length:258 start_codon:yes stop_codon:yes gene_type:complete